MSHVVTIKTQVRDAQAVQAACRRLGIDQPQQGTSKLFAESATGLAVKLAGWRYPVVFDLQSGQLRFDNFGGHWGEQQKLDAFLHAYAVEKAKIESLKRGHTVTEQSLADGSIKLTIHVGGES